jgi:hypothetical protein
MGKRPASKHPHMLAERHSPSSCISVLTDLEIGTWLPSQMSTPAPSYRYMAPPSSSTPRGHACLVLLRYWYGIDLVCQTITLSLLTGLPRAVARSIVVFASSKSCLSCMYLQRWPPILVRLQPPLPPYFYAFSSR